MAMQIRQWALGAVDTVYWNVADLDARRALARADGFAHLDTRLVDADADPQPRSLRLRVGCPTAFPRPAPTWCATPAPPRGDDPDAAWARTVRWWSAAPQALLEPWAGGSVATMDDVRRLQRHIPELRLCVDTGHVADVGGDIDEFLALAAHVQLRQGCIGHTQLHVGDPLGAIDFQHVFDQLEQLDYRGCLSIEYFDLAEFGWPLADPRGWALDLAQALVAADHDR